MATMDWKKYLRGVNLDSTSYCNAKCAACSRNDDYNNNEKQPWLPLTHMSVDLWEKISIELKEFPMIEELVWNGSWGDACMNPKLHDFLKIWGTHHPQTYVEVNTNGGTYNPKWWGDLAKICRHNLAHHRFVVAIDGVGEESHGKYRRSTSYDKIIDNMKAFTDNGGIARWTMTLFNHNFHQIEEALEIAKEVGFVEFEVRQSHIDQAQYVDENGVTQYIKTDEVTDEYFNRLSFKYGHDIIVLDEEKRGALGGEPWDREIRPKSLGHQCHWFDVGKIQIDPWGNIWPCCHTSDTSINPPEMETGVLKFIDESDRGFNNANDHTMTEILTHPWYEEYLDKVVNTAEMPVCVEFCNVKKII